MPATRLRANGLPPAQVPPARVPASQAAQNPPAARALQPALQAPHLPPATPSWYATPVQDIPSGSTPRLQLDRQPPLRHLEEQQQVTHTLQGVTFNRLPRQTRPPTSQWGDTPWAKKMTHQQPPRERPKEVRRQHRSASLQHPRPLLAHCARSPGARQME